MRQQAVLEVILNVVLNVQEGGLLVVDSEDEVIIETDNNFDNK